MGIINDIKCSIIIPAYNAAEYIKDCLGSILPYKDESIEVIVVDDGSTDATKEICKRYLKDIVFISQENSGVSSARNNGINHAKGKYILFLDCDDYIYYNQLTTVLSRTFEKDVDLAYFGMDIEYYENEKLVEIESLLPKFKSTENHKEIFSHMFGGAIGINENDLKAWANNRPLREKKLKGFSFIYLFKKELIDRYNIRFRRQLKYNEDLIFIAEYFMRCKSMLSFDNIVYRYCRRGKGATEVVYHNSEIMAKNKLMLLEAKSDMRNKAYTELNIDILPYFIASNILSLIDMCAICVDLPYKEGHEQWIKFYKLPIIRKSVKKISMSNGKIYFRILLFLFKLNGYEIFYTLLKVAAIFHIDIRKLITKF